MDLTFDVHKVFFLKTFGKVAKVICLTKLTSPNHSMERMKIEETEFSELCVVLPGQKKGR